MHLALIIALTAPAQLCEQAINHAHATFGRATAVDGDRVVVGAGFYLNQPGGAWVYKRTAYDQWQLEDELVRLDRFGTNIVFGKTVDISGDRAIVDSTTGSVLVFRRDGSQWVFERTLAASSEINAPAQLDGDLVCASGKIFKRSGTTWPMVASYGSSYATCDAHDGTVALSNGAGSYTFWRNDGAAPHGTTLTASGGGSFAVDGGNFALLGNNDVRLYELSAGIWSLSSTLPVPLAGQETVSRVDLDGDVLAVSGGASIINASTIRTWVWTESSPGFWRGPLSVSHASAMFVVPISVSRLTDRGRVIIGDNDGTAYVFDVPVLHDDNYAVGLGQTLNAGYAPMNDPQYVDAPSLAQNDARFQVGGGPAITLTPVWVPSGLYDFDGAGRFRYDAPLSILAGDVDFDVEATAAGCLLASASAVLIDVPGHDFTFTWTFNPWPYFFIDMGDPPPPWVLQPREPTMIALEPTSRAFVELEEEPSLGFAAVVDDPSSGAQYLMFYPAVGASGTDALRIRITDENGNVAFGAVEVAIR